MPRLSHTSAAPVRISRVMPTVLYVAAHLPHLSETFVYREFLGMRGQGYSMLGASVHAPRRSYYEPSLEALKGEIAVIYSVRTACRLPYVLIRHPLLALSAVCDAARADHPNWLSRLKHVIQGFMGIATGERMRALGIGHVHAHMANVPAMAALYIARTLNVPFSFTGHAADLFVHRSALAFKLKEADFVACISRWHRDFYNGVVPAEDRRRPIVRCSVALPRLKHQPSTKTIIVVARLVAKKGIDLLLQAFVRASLKGWNVRIVGDGPERARLEKMVDELGCADRVIFDGARPHAFCLAAIAQADFFVLPCRTSTDGDKDGIPVALMEAMAASRPVIAGCLPTITELIEDGKSGLLITPDDVPRLSDAIQRLANDTELRVRLGSQARARISEEFSDAINLDRLARAFGRARGS